MNLYCATIPFFKLLILSLLGVVSGCCHYKIPTEAFAQHVYSENEQSAQAHPLYKIIPRHRSQIEWYDAGHWTTWMLFGNDDDGIFGESFSRPYKPDEKNTFIKALYWAGRNPMHNFCFYTIGSAHRTNSEFILFSFGDSKIYLLHYEPVAKRVFGGKGTSFLLALHGGKPFISLRIVYTPTCSSQFYFGWRERGNFGIKLSPLKIKK